MKRICARGTWTAAVAVTLGLGSVASPQPSIALAARTQSAGPSVSTLHFFVPGRDSTQPPRPSEVAQIPLLRRSIALDLHGVTRDHALDGIAHTAGLSVVYASDVIPRSGSVVLVNPAITIGAAFEAVLGGLPLDVLIEPNGTIVLSARGAGAAAGASIRVQLSEQLSKLPLEGALVSLLASDGATATEGLTDAHGIRVLSTQAAGEYRVRVRRIGYRPFTSEPVKLAIGDTVRIQLAIPSVAIALPAVTSTAKPKACKRGEGEQLASSELWDQIRIALETSELTRTDTSVHTLLRNVNRRTSASGDLLGVAGASQSLGRDRPYTARPPADLSANGYVRTSSDPLTLGSLVFHGPDATVLLSPEFENDHCFTMVPGSGPAAGLIGLSFDPASDHTRADISGVLWVAASSARLEYLDYRYVNFHSAVSAPRAGGRIIFDRLPSGEWIVSTWVIHTPDIAGGVSGGSVIGNAGGTMTLVNRPARLIGYADVGGSAEMVAIGPLVASPSTDVTIQTDQLASSEASCAASTTPLTVTVHDTSSSSALATELTGVGTAIVEVNWFEPATAAGGTRSAIGLPQVAQADASGTARLCLGQHAGQPLVVAHASSVMSAATPFVVSDSAPIAVSLSVDGRHVPTPIGPGGMGGKTAPSLPSGSSRMDVLVRDASGAPVEGTVIEVNGWQYTAATTNGSGRLSLNDLPGGTAILDVWRPGYARQRLAVDLAPKKTRAIEIRLVSDAVGIGGGGAPPTR